MLIKVIFKREVGRSEGTETDGVYSTAIKLNFLDGSNFKQGRRDQARHKIIESALYYCNLETRTPIIHVTPLCNKWRLCDISAVSSAINKTIH